MAKKGFKDVNMLFLGGGLLLVVLFFLGAYKVKEGFIESSGTTVKYNQAYLTSDGTTGEAWAKSLIEPGLKTTCSQTATSAGGTNSTLGTITYTVTGTTAKKTKFQGSATCSWS